MPSSGDNSLPDKKALYGVFQAGQDWQSKLYRKGAHKALDIADDDMAIHANRTQTGLGALGVAGVALAAGGLPAALLALQALRGPALPAALPPQPPALAAPAGAAPKPLEWQFEIGVDKDGNWKTTEPKQVP